MSTVKIRVGAALDSSALRIFDPLEKRAAQAAKNVQKSLNEGVDGRGPTRTAKATGDALDRELERMANKMLRDRERAERGITSVVERETRERTRIASRAAADAERIDRDARGRFVGRGGATSVKRGLGLGFGIGAGAIAAGGAIAKALAESIGVDLSVAGHMMNAQHLQQRVTDLVNAGYVPGGAGSQGIRQNAADVTQDINAAGDATAFSHGDIAEGLQKFVALTGDLETGRKTLLETAELARATGSEFGVMAEASAEVANHLGNMPNKAESVASVMRV